MQGEISGGASAVQTANWYDPQIAHLEQADLAAMAQAEISGGASGGQPINWYDPQIAHFVQPDSIIPAAGSSKGYDRYGYVDNNPVNRTDPSGHFAPLVGAAVGAIVGFSVDILIQSVPQMMNGTSPLDVNINWAEAGGAAVAGLASGLTLGFAAALVPAGATVGTSIATMSFAGGVGNAFGNQVGAITSGVIEHGFTQEGVITARDKYGFQDWKKIGVDFAVGGLAAGFTEGISQASAFAKIPKIIEPKYSLAPNGGTSYQYVSKPDMTILGHPSLGPSFNNPIKPVSIYSGLTTFSNYSENLFTSKVSDAILRRKNLE